MSETSVNVAPQTELHRHLDVSIRTSTLLELAQKQGLEGQSTSLEGFRKKFMIDRPLPDLDAALSQFTLFQKVLDRPEVLERVAFEAVEDCWHEGTRKVEFRYSPTFVTEFNSMSWTDSLVAFQNGLEHGLQKYKGMKAGLLCIAGRNEGIETVDQVIDFFLVNQSRFIGLDLASFEIPFPCRLFEASFKKAIQRNAKITIHAGEATGPEAVWEAIELLGATRIGHGVSSIRDPQLVEYLAKNQICLEMCPTSNWLTHAVPSFSEHPLPLLLRAGVPVCINTDDPGIFDVTLPHEISICKEQMGMSDAEIKECFENANRLSFLPE